MNFGIAKDYALSDIFYLGALRGTLKMFLKLN